MDPIQSAKAVFEESVKSLMAHTIRGMQNYFFNHAGLQLEVKVIADKAGRIPLLDPRQGITSVLHSRLLRKSRPGEYDRVLARIYIHGHANKDLARICIAHEMYHLLLELEQYREDLKTDPLCHWPVIPLTKSVEDACDQFAWQLCRDHDKFNRSDKIREKLIYFPKNMFATAINTNSTQQDRWPDGVRLDPDHPFYKPQIPE
ncbi:MAG: hypothetical protein ABMA13_13045 [Chthoniobacteraceae bacterium]